MLITVVRVFLTNPDARDIGNVVRDEYTERTKQKKTCRKEEDGNG